MIGNYALIAFVNQLVDYIKAQITKEIKVINALSVRLGEKIATAWKGKKLTEHVLVRLKSFENAQACAGL